MFKFLLFLIISIFSFKSFCLDIEETIKNTVQTNPKVKISLEKLLESKELIEAASGAKLPTITSTISGIYEKSETTTSTATTTPETFTDKYKLSITQNLYDAGYNDLEIERSKILFDNEVLNFKIVIQDLILDAINGYLIVINYEQSLEARKKNYESVSKALEEIKTRFNLGSATLYELHSAESSFAVATASLFAAEQNLKISKESFKRISGIKAIDMDDVVHIITSVDILKVIDNATKNNYNLQIIKNNIKNIEILLLKEKKAQKPSLDLTGSAEYSDGGRMDDGSETTKGSIALTLTGRFKYSFSIKSKFPSSSASTNLLKVKSEDLFNISGEIYIFHFLSLSIALLLREEPQSINPLSPVLIS